jgi:circadian clock protein KaiC
MMVKKIRGVRFREGYHDLRMETGGLVMFPRLVAAEHHRAFPMESIASGIPGLDRALGGGIDRGTSTIFMGPAGTGKSILTMRFALSAAQRDESILFFTFDETTRTLLNRTRQLGFDVEPHIESGRIKVRQIDPAEISPGELADHIKRGVQDDGARMVVIDSLNGFMHAMAQEQLLTLQLHELLTYLRQRGIVTIMVVAQHGLLGGQHAPVDVSYIADNVLLFRFVEIEGCVRRALSVMKKRAGRHEHTVHELILGPEGVQVGAPITRFGDEARIFRDSGSRAAPGTVHDD